MIRKTLKSILRWLASKPPPYVSCISGSRISLDGDIDCQEWLLRIADTKLGRTGIPLGLKSADGECRRLNETLVALNRNGVLFLEDHRQGWCPASIMADLQDKQVITESFRKITWDGSGRWQVTEVPLGEDGTSG